MNAFKNFILEAELRNTPKINSSIVLFYNQAKQEYVNTLNNLGVRGQLLYKPNDNINITLIADATTQHPNGYAQVYAGVTPTLRSSYRQFNTIATALNYKLPSTNPFDRIIDQDTPARSNQDLGGVSLNADFKLGSGTLTSTTAWRYWKWDPSTDRDFTGLQALNLSQAPSKHNQWSQEVRWAGNLSSKVTGVFGVFAFVQNLKSDSVQTEEAGKDQWRFSSTDATAEALWKTPGLLDGFGTKTKSDLTTFSGAIFGQVDWAITKNLHVLPGLRVNYDRKKVDYQKTTYGGLQTTNATLLALKKSVYSDQSFNADKDNTNISGQLTVAYKVSKSINAFATYARSYKPVGLNLGSLPTPAAGSTLADLAVVKPEKVNHYEIGVKTTPTSNSTLNITIYNTDINDYQTLVQSPELGVNRGYLSNAEKVNVRGAELDGDIKVNKNLSFYGSISYTDGKYVSFTNAPLPLEETGLKDANGKSVYFKDISGSDLPGISKWAGSLGGEISTTGTLLGNTGKFFLASDVFFRTEFSSSPSPSKYLVVPGYGLLNARLGFRSSESTSIYLWARNLLNQNYFEQLLPGAGNSGQYAAVLGDPRTFGVTIKYAF